MAFDLGAFIAGASEGAATAIDKRNKEIRQNTLREFDQLQKEAGEQTEKLRTKRDEMKATAEVLAGYRGANGVQFTNAQIVGILQNPQNAKMLAKELKEKEDGLGTVDFNKVFTLSKEVNETNVPKWQDYINQVTSIPKDIPEEPRKVVRGAFGLESPAYGQAQAEFEASTGKSLREIRATAKGPMDPGTVVQGDLDLSQFKKPETVAMIQARLSDNIAKGDTDLTSAKNKPLMDRLSANALIQAKFDKDKPEERTTAQINSVFSLSLRAALDPYVRNGTIRFDDKDQVVVITGDAKAIDDFVAYKNSMIEKQARAMGLINKDNTINGGQKVRDALLPYAEFDGDKIISFKPNTNIPAKPPAAPAPGTAAPATPAKPASTKTGTVVDKAIPLPKDAIVNGVVDPTKLITDQEYIDRNGKTKTWGGTGWKS